MATTPTQDRAKDERLLIDISDIVRRDLKLNKLETPNGKGIQVNKDARGYLEITFKTGGELPNEFGGLFTDIRAVSAAIRAYLDRIKSTSNAKTKSDKAQD